MYWTLFAGVTFPQVQIAAVPLKAHAKVTNIGNSSQNDLSYTSGMGLDSAGRLWILSFGQYAGNPTSALVFKLPLKSSSKPLHTFVLSGTSGADALAFDPSGNLWVASAGNHEAMEYKGPFDRSGTLSPAVTLSGGSVNDYGIAVDKNANVYVSDNNSTGTKSIIVVAPPYKKAPYFLDGLTAPGGLLFDKHGNLYASTNGSSGAAVVRYDSNDLKSGDKPSIVDPAGLPDGSYEAAFAFTSKGDLYAANCGNTAGIDVYPTGTKPFSAKLAPALQYSNDDIQQAGCAWGIAIK